MPVLGIASNHSMLPLPLPKGAVDLSLLKSIKSRSVTRRLQNSEHVDQWILSGVKALNELSGFDADAVSSVQNVPLSPAQPGIHETHP